MSLSDFLRQRKEPKHALLSPSKCKQWKDYDEESLLKMVKSANAAEIGTIIHEYAADRIKWGLKLAKGEKKSIIFELYRAGVLPIAVDMVDTNFIFENLINYVNDAIGFHMEPEVEVRYSEWCFGTADALLYSEKDKFLRIHDLKTGILPAHMDQLITYAALYFLQHRVKVVETTTELRIYQAGEIIQHIPESDEILEMMENIIQKSSFIEQLNSGRIR